MAESVLNDFVLRYSDMNRYAAQVTSGSWLVRSLKAIRWELNRPRDLQFIGEGTRIIKPFRRINGRVIRLGHRVLIGKNCLFQPISRYLDQEFKPSIVIGNDCYIGPDCQFHSVSKIELGPGCVLSDQVYISDVAHGLNPTQGLIMDQPVVSKGPVTIGAGCFVGFGSVIMSGVSLGEQCVVGARSVVTRSFPARTMLAGSPAKVIAVFDQKTEQWVKI